MTTLLEQIEEAQHASDEHAAHLQAILDHDDNDLSPNDEAALRYFIDIASRPSFRETVRLDSMWQRLVREKEAAEREAARLRAENKQARDYLARVLVRHAPQCDACDGLMEVCSQIDDMASFIASFADSGRSSQELHRFRAREQLVEQVLLVVAEDGCGGTGSVCRISENGEGNCDLCVAYRALRDFGTSATASTQSPA